MPITSYFGQRATTASGLLRIFDTAGIGYFFTHPQLRLKSKMQHINAADPFLDRYFAVVNVLAYVKEALSYAAMGRILLAEPSKVEAETSDIHIVYSYWAAAVAEEVTVAVAVAVVKK